jgi:hypothetical protein
VCKCEDQYRIYECPCGLDGTFYVYNFVTFSWYVADNLSLHLIADENNRIYIPVNNGSEYMVIHDVSDVVTLTTYTPPTEVTITTDYKRYMIIGLLFILLLLLLYLRRSILNSRNAY